jgi:hypothetical protein
MAYYRAFGLTFRSDRPLPYLDEFEESNAFDYSLRFERIPYTHKALRGRFGPPSYSSPWRLKGGRSAVRVWETEDCGYIRFLFYDGVEFIVDREHRDIWVVTLPGAEINLATRHLLFSLPGFLLGLRKSACLQGAVVGRGKCAIALLGKSNSGKSVLSAALAARGMPVLSDDLVALDLVEGDIKVYPGYPWICLRPESLKLLNNQCIDSSRLSSSWQYLDETYVTWDLRQTRPMTCTSESNPKTLEAIYLLAPTEDSNCQPFIEPLLKPHAFMTLISAANSTHIPYPGLTMQEFFFMGSVVTVVPTYRLQFVHSAECIEAASKLLENADGVRSVMEQ